MDEFTVEVATADHLGYVDEILKTIEDATKVRGTGIAKRNPEYVKKKMLEGKAIIAMNGDDFAGFCYIESWDHGEFVANSGLIVKEKYRGHGLAKRIKRRAFELSRERFPEAKIFGLTTGLAVMKINTELGYVPVTFSELTSDPVFWKGCESCINFDVLLRNNYTRCLCTGMLYDPKAHDNGRIVEEKISDGSASVLRRIRSVFSHIPIHSSKSEPSATGEPSSKDTPSSKQS